MSKPYIGGQAVLEGVMMRSPRSFVVVVRRPDGQLAVREQAWRDFGAGFPFLRWPVLRGSLTLFESLWNGYSALMFAAEHATPEAEKPAEGDGAIAATMFGATLFAIALFLATPHVLTIALGRLFSLDLPTTGMAFHAIEGVVKLVVLVSYVGLVSRLPEMRRVFQFHGAEHKAIWAYESGGPLTPEEAQRFTTIHPRCGTSFLVMVMGVSLIVTTLVFSQVGQLSPYPVLHHALLVLLKIPLMFPIAGLTYELQKWTARPDCPRVITLLARPGMWLQRVTTQEPSLDQLEVAVTALQRALAREEGRGGAEGVELLPSRFAPAAA